MQLLRKVAYSIILQAVITILILISNSLPGKAQSQEKSYAVLLFNFARGIQWPQNNKDHFVIGILGYPPLASELKEFIFQKQVWNKPIRIEELSSPQEIKACDILFIPFFKGKLLPEILEKLGNSSTLIVTNNSTLLKQGCGISFTLKEGKVQYEMNLSLIETRGLRVSNSVRGMGLIVKSN